MKIGIITIGQSPRNDVVGEIGELLNQAEIVQRGCLDDLTNEQRESLNPEETEPFLVTVLRDGSSVQVSKEKTVQLLQQRIKELESKDVASIVLLCTGDFPDLESKKLLIQPGKLIRELVEAMLTLEGKLGVVVPCSEQIDQIQKKWSHLNPVVAVASPYENSGKIQDAAKKLRAENVDLTVLDCIGYTRQMKQTVREITGKPVILARSLLARVLRELCYYCPRKMFCAKHLQKVGTLHLFAFNSFVLKLLYFTIDLLKGCVDICNVYVLHSFLDQACGY